MTPKKALIVDDSRLAQFVLKKMLVAESIAVDTSESAEDALGYLANHKPDLIFLDHTMPGMNGLEALKVIKANPNTATIPVMMYTSQEDINYMSQAKELGAVGVVPKQVKASELKQALNRLGKDALATPGSNLAQDELAPRDTVELKQLVKAAEVALEKETSQQQMRLRLDKIQGNIEDALGSLNEKIDRVLPTAENNNNRQMFWNNLLWGAIYGVTVLFFGLAYFQHQSAIETIVTRAKQSGPINSQPLSTTPATEAEVTPSQTENQAPPVTQPNTNSVQANTNTLDLGSLEQIVNNNSQIPYGELLLGETIESSLNDLIPTLQSINFTGEVMMLAHDGTFCLTPNSSGQFLLSNDDIPISQCQLAEPSDSLADIASIDLLQLVTSSNQSPDNDFIITINPVGASQPLVPYPEGESTAGVWNSIALQNRRVIIKLIEGD